MSDEPQDPHIDGIEPEDDGYYEHFRLTVDGKQSPVRIDKFLFDRLPNISRNKIQHAVNDGYVLVNEETTKVNYKVRPGDLIVLSLPHPPRDGEIVPEDIPLHVVYEDDDLLIVNKSPGMVVHPAHGNWTGTLVNALAYRFQQLPPSHRNGSEQPGLVHRIDKDTSGLLVVAKNEQAMTHLGHQFYKHSIERTYHALVWGEPAPAADTINVNLARSPKDRRVTEAFPEGDVGRRAVTHYQTLRTYRYVTLLQLRLETGRTHQIRAHMRYRGHPLFNDAMYGGNRVLKGTMFSKYKAFVDNCFRVMPRQALHAKSLGFVHPRTGERMFFESELPEDFRAVLDRWENYVRYEAGGHPDNADTPGLSEEGPVPESSDRSDPSE